MKLSSMVNGLEGALAVTAMGKWDLGKIAQPSQRERHFTSELDALRGPLARPKSGPLDKGLSASRGRGVTG